MTTATQPITLAPLGVDPALLDQVAATASAVDKGEVDARYILPLLGDAGLLDADLLTTGADETHLGDADPFIDTGLADNYSSLSVTMTVAAERPSPRMRAKASHVLVEHGHRCLSTEPPRISPRHDPVPSRNPGGISPLACRSWSSSRSLGTLPGHQTSPQRADTACGREPAHPGGPTGMVVPIPIRSSRLRPVGGTARRYR